MFYLFKNNFILKVNSKNKKYYLYLKKLKQLGIELVRVDTVLPSHTRKQYFNISSLNMLGAEF